MVERESRKRIALKTKLKEGTGKGQNGEALQGDRRLMLGGGFSVWEKSDFFLVL